MLLLFGRCLALLINLLVQVLTVRYLVKEEFGAFAFAVTMVALGSNIAILGLTKSIARFVPIYQERNDKGLISGAIVLLLSVVLGLGLAIVVTVFAVRHQLAGTVGSPLSLSLLLLMIVLVPVESLDRLFESLFAAFGVVKSVFIRRHLMGPGLKLLAVAAVILLEGSVHLLALFYVLAGVGGVIFYALLLRQTLKAEGLLPYFSPARWTLPAKELLAYSLPLLSSQIGFVVRTSLAVLLLETLSGSAQVAEFRAVFPFARLNEVVLTSFGFLFVPVAARYFARQDLAAIDRLYWSTSVWIAVLSLPAFLVTGVLARPFTTLVFGERYEQAGAVLMILATGFFLETVMGFNVHTLRVFARVRQIVVIDFLTILLAVGLCLALIPAHGAWGAAVAICAATLLQNVLFQIAMHWSAGIRAPGWRNLQFFAGCAAVVTSLAIIQWTWSPPLWLGMGAAAVSYVVLVWANRSLLDVEGTFPELLRLPVIGRVLGGLAKPKFTAISEAKS